MSDNIKIESYTPVEYIEDDLFNLSPFVDSLYDLLNIINPERGFVISLNGEWGAGKSTVINFLKEKCLKKGNEANFTIVDFLPWNIIDKQTLLKSYFITLKNCILKEDNNSKIIRLLEKYYSAIIEGIKFIPKITPLTDLINSFISIFLNKNEKSIFDLKNEIIDYLAYKYRGKNIIICIDDLDRLTDEEICVVLKLIKEIADFPRIIYLISMDKAHVINAINNHYNYKDTEKGYNYLEKFIQLERHLPQINTYDIEKFFFNEIQNFIDKKLYIGEKNYLHEIYNNCLKEKIDNPRKLILFINQYKINYKRIENYVNFVDYLPILFYQLFYPDFYMFIKENKDLLTLNSIESEKKEENSKLLDNKLDYISCKKEYAYNVLNHLFPDWPNNNSLESTIEYSPSNDFMRNLVRAKDWFDFYFGKIDYKKESVNELIDIVESTDNNKIIGYLNISDVNLPNSYLKKIQYLFYCWNYLNNTKEHLKNILLGIIKFCNNKNESNLWFDLIKKNVFECFDRTFYEPILLDILIDADISQIYQSFLYLLYSGNIEFTKRYISDDMCHQILQLFISKIIEYKRQFANLDPLKLIDLLLKHEEFNSLEKYVKKYPDHCVILIFYILGETFCSKQYFNKELLNRENLNSESFWKNIGNGELSFMDNYNDVIISFIKKEKYKRYDSVFGTTLEGLLKQYAKIVNLEIS